jgi:hypothetical protein
MVSRPRFPVPTARHGTRHSPVTVVNAVISHGVGVGREGGVKVDCYNKSGVGRPAYIVLPTVVCAATVPEPETLDECQVRFILTFAV